MTTEQRPDNLENAMVQLVDYEGKVQSLAEQLAAQSIEYREETAEFRREAGQMQRLWVHLARKHGWLEEDDWPPPEGTE